MKATEHNPFSRAKAKKVLSEKEPTLKKRKITDPQRKLLGFIAGGGKVNRSLSKK